MQFDQHREYGESLDHEEEHYKLKMVALGILTVIAGITLFYGGWFLFSLL